MVLLAITYTLVDHATVTSQGPAQRALSTGASGRRPAAGAGRFLRTQTPDGARITPALGAQITRLLGSQPGRVVVQFGGSNQRISDLHQLVVESSIALAIMAIISDGARLGGRRAGARPLRTMTATTQQISEANLHRRLAMQGPRDELRQLADTIDGLLARLEGGVRRPAAVRGQRVA